MLKTNTIYHGDCLNWMKKIDDKSIDMILTDLPYGITACKWDIVIPLELLWEQYKRIIKDKGAIVLTASQPFTSMLVMSNLKMFKHSWIWNKGKAGNFATVKYNPLRVTEDILVFSLSSPIYFPQKILAEKKNKRNRNNECKSKKETTHGIASGIFKVSENHNENERFPHNIIDIKSTENECNNIHRLHPTQKPVPLFEYLIKTYSNDGDLVLDSCAGSFTTAVACENLKRKWICIEKEKEYCEVGLKRIKENRIILKGVNKWKK